MRVSVDAVDCCILPRLATPPVRIANKEKLRLREMAETWQILVWRLLGAAVPGLEGGGETASVCDVFA
jgi:hypothetical protein